MSEAQEKQGGRQGGGRDGSRGFFRRRKSCPFSNGNEHLIDYKNVKILKQYLTERGRMIPSRITSVSAKHQRAIATEIKRARFLGLLPYVVKE